MLGTSPDQTTLPYFWEPADYGVYDFENYRYCDGPALALSNMYPQMYSRIFYDEMSKAGKGSVVNLLRCAWAGSQGATRYLSPNIY